MVGLMTVLRLMPLSAHAALEFLAGAVLMALPFVLGFSAAGMVACLVAGALVAGLALSAAARDAARPGMALSDHLAFDRLLSLTLIGGGLFLATRGDQPAALALLAAGLLQLSLTLTTRYSART